jgi:hypothetical protein
MQGQGKRAYSRSLPWTVAGSCGWASGYVLQVRLQAAWEQATPAECASQQL